MSRYKTARALEMAVKSAAQNSEFDTSSAIAGFYYHRLLVRIFAGGDSPFILKGGHGMLARTIDARRTRDIDIATNRLDIDEALYDLRNLISRDMDDFLVFDVAGYALIKTGDRYRDGYSVIISVTFGGRSMQQISIDLVADEVECKRPEYLTPADRLDIADLPVCDYPVYPAVAAVADKLCGVIEMHNGRVSSRVKDLVDLVIYATHERFDGEELIDQLRQEGKSRGLVLPELFHLPKGWEESYGRQYARLVAQTNMKEEYPTMGDAAKAVSRFLDPALNASCRGKRWEPAALEWVLAE